jgi:hypothetical protein
MTRDLIARAAAAQAAADADREPRCHWCGETQRELSLAIYAHAGRVLECVNASACHARFETLNPIVRPSTTPDGRETGRTAPHAPESSTEGT